MQRVTLLGATGSIGDSCVKVLRKNKSHYAVHAVAAHRNYEKLASLCLEFQPAYAVLIDSHAARNLRELLRGTHCPTQVMEGESAMIEIARDPSNTTVIAAIVGAAGLPSTLAAIQAGKRVLLANKESLVMSGALMMDAVRQYRAQLLPIDSEHNAIFQCLPQIAQREIGYCDLTAAGIEKILLTGSGGPFLRRALDSLSSVTMDEAIAHPNWSMGAKISVDSATMMNKGLEYIEARWLFNLSQEVIEVLIHPQSVIHSMVSFRDGSVLAQLGRPDMATPIAHALGYPERIDAGVAPLDFLRCGDLSFAAPDPQRYPCLALAIDACWRGQSATTALNAANEIAVDAFLRGKIGFMQIPALCEQALMRYGDQQCHTLEEILLLDRSVRNDCRQQLAKIGRAC